MNTRSVAISAGVGGLAAGLLSSFPGLSCLNYVLCLWVWVGGALAVYIYSRMEQKPVTSGQGAILGALSGLVGALILSALSLAFGALAMSFLAMTNREASDQLLPMFTTQGIVFVLSIFFYLIIFPGIGALAGLIGVEMFGKPAPHVMG